MGESGAGDGNRTHVRSLGSSRSATELRPLVVSDCTQELIFRTAVSGILQLGADESAGLPRASALQRVMETKHPERRTRGLRVCARCGDRWLNASVNRVL